MGIHSDRRQASTAVLLILLLAGQEVTAMRDKISVHSQQRAKVAEKNVRINSSFTSADVWDDLKVAASEDAKDARCAPASETLYQKAYTSMTSQMDNLAAACAEAKEAGFSKCMGGSSGVSSTKVIRQAYRFQALTRKFSDCDWAREFALKNKETNEGLGPKLDAIYQNAPEFEKIRKMHPGINFAGFVSKLSAVEDGNQAEDGVMEALSSSFGFAGSAEDTKKAFAQAQEKNFGPDDIQSVSSDQDTDDLVNDMEPEWCFRQHRWFGHNSGCSNGGYWGTESCYSFQATNGYDSEKATKDYSVKHQTKPSDLVSEDAVLSLNRAGNEKRQSGGYLKSSKHTWGICLPKKDAYDKLTKINDVRAKALEDAQVHVKMSDEASALVQANETMGDEQLQSLVQRVQDGTISKAEFFGYILQIPALICLGVLYFIAFVVFIPIWILQLVVTGITYPLKIMGNLGKLIRFVLAMPVCIVGSIFQIFYEWIRWIFDTIYWIGSKLGGKKIENKTDSEETYMGNVCNLFRNGYFAKGVAPHIEAHA